MIIGLYFINNNSQLLAENVVSDKANTVVVCLTADYMYHLSDYGEIMATYTENGIGH